MKPWPYPKWIAHRGAGKLAPENTLSAFQLGANYGYRMFECDAKLSRDGVVFLMHDADLERTTNGEGIAGSHDWSYLSHLDAGSWHSATYTGEALPTLESLAQFCISNGYFLNIEIKPTPGTEAITGSTVAKEAMRLWQDESIPPLLTSFKTEALVAAQQTAPLLPRGLLLDSLWDGWLDAAVEIECVAIVCNYRLWNKELIETVHAQNIQCLSYTVNEQNIANSLMAIGMDGIITDAVDKLGSQSK
jgi:glycerophosphoryl diester phosphodiesterase